MSGPYAVRGRIVTPNSIIVDGAVIIEGDSIVWMGEAPDAQAAGFGAQVVAAPSPTDGRYILPGLVDTHCHGGAGASFPDAASAEDMMTAIWEHRIFGTTTMVGSLMVASPEVLRRQGQMMADLCDSGELAGIHFEGPFLASGRIGVTGMLPGGDGLLNDGLTPAERTAKARSVLGAQDFDKVQPPNPALTRELMITMRGHTVSMTLAPEGKRAIGSGSVAEVLIENGAIPAYGHTVASAEFMREAAAWTREKMGLTPAETLRSGRYVVTHFLNGMQSFHHRDPGPMLEILADAAGGGCVLEMIADGVHVAPSVLRNVFELVGRESVVFVSDANPAAGMPDGDYVLGGREITVQDEVSRVKTSETSPAMGTATDHTNATHGTIETGENPEATENAASEAPLAGSNRHLVDMVRTAWKVAGIPLTDAVYCASAQGAAILGDDTVGEIAVGKKADLLVTDEDLYPLSVYRRGVMIASVPAATA